MSELSARLADLKGHKTTLEITQKAGLSRETFRKIERGEGVKLSTLRQIFEAMDLPEEKWVDVLIAWIKTEIGPEASKLWIESKDPKDMGSDQTAQVVMLFEALNAADRAQILKTMQRRTVLNCLPAINQVWEKTESEKAAGTSRGGYEIEHTTPQGNEQRLIHQSVNVASSSQGTDKSKRRPPGREHVYRNKHD